MNDITFVGGSKKIKIKCKDLSLRNFYNRRNKVLIFRDTGGLGDILMMRMIFDDIRKIMPESIISFAAPIDYHKSMLWHPNIDEILNSKEIDENQFGIHYNLTTICVRYEMAIRPKADRHRAEIWASYCGFQLTSPDMKLNMPDALVEYGKERLLKTLPRNKGYVCFAPISNMISKDLGIDQIEPILKGIRDLGYSPFIVHNKNIEVNCPILKGSLDQWLSLINASDYVVTVDTAVFHAANGFKKPTVGIFSWADGKVYSKFHPCCIIIQRHRSDTPGWTCGPCYDHMNCPKTKEERKPCITEITPEEVLKSFNQLLGSYSPTFLSDIRQESKL